MNYIFPVFGMLLFHMVMRYENEIDMEILQQYMMPLEEFMVVQVKERERSIYCANYHFSATTILILIISLFFYVMS